MTFSASHPGQKVKWSVDIRPPHRDYKTPLIYLHRPENLPTKPDHWEPGVVRQNLLDSLPLDAKTFEKISRLIGESGLWEKDDVIGLRSDGVAYKILLKDSLRSHSFSVMGKTGDAAIDELISLCADQFQSQFPTVDVLDSDCEIGLLRGSAVREVPDTLHVRIKKEGRDAKVYRDGAYVDSMTSDRFVEMWQIMENNRVWEITSNDEYGSRYPIRYEIHVRRGHLKNSWTVFAASKLSDKRYFNIISHIENLAAGHP